MLKWYIIKINLALFLYIIDQRLSFQLLKASAVCHPSVDSI